MTKTQIILSISVLINIFLIGYLTGNKINDRNHREKHPHHDRRHGPDFKIDKELHEEIKTKRHELFEIMAAPEFNEKAFDAKVQEIEVLHQKVKDQMPARLKQKVLGKTQEQRIKFVQRIKRKHRHRM